MGVSQSAETIRQSRDEGGRVGNAGRWEGCDEGEELGDKELGGLCCGAVPACGGCLCVGVGEDKVRGKRCRMEGTTE